MIRYFMALFMPVVFTVFYGCSVKHSIYDETEDAYKVFEKTLSTMKPSKDILLVFGANWCKDCIVLDENMQQKPLKSFIKKHFIVIKVDVGSEGRNQKLRDWFGSPTKNGLPAIAIVSSDKNILYQSHAGEFSRARNLTVDDILNFFQDNMKRDS